MNENLNEKIALYKEYNSSMEKFKRNNFTANRFYIVLLAVILLIILTAKQIFGAGSLLFTFIFSFFGLCISVMWLIVQDNYSQLIKIKLGKVLEEIEKELPVKPYTIEHAAISEYKKNKKFYSYDNLQNFLAFAVALVFTLLFFSQVMPFFMWMKAILFAN